MDNILREGNPILKEKSTDVALPLSKENELLLESMIDYIFDSIDEEKAEKYHLRPAVGLAAPQVGKNLKMLVIYCFDEQGVEHFYAMVNPKLISYSEEQTYLDTGEGCLSVDRVTHGYVHRAKRVTVDTFLYEDGKLRKERLRLRGYLSVVFQHEFDHLNGILFVDRINKKEPFQVPEHSTPVVFPTND